MARAKQPVSVGGIEFDALIDSEESFEADIPSYPTEKGYEVSDTVIIKPLVVTMTLYVTDTPVTWRDRTGAYTGKTEAVVKKLEELYTKKEPVEITTTDKVYESMGIQNYKVKKTLEAGYAREIPITFQQIEITETSTTTIPDSYGKSGKTASKSGTASTKKASGTVSGAGSASSGSSSSSSSSSNSGSSGGSGSSSGGSVLYNAANKFGLL